MDERAAAEDAKRRRVFVPSAAAVADPSLYFAEYQAFQKNPDGVSKPKKHQPQLGQVRHQEQQPQKLPQQEPAVPANNNGGAPNRQRAGGGFDLRTKKPAAPKKEVVSGMGLLGGYGSDSE